MSKRPSLKNSRSERRATVVLVYSRPGCHLCEQAIEAIVRMRGEGYEFELREVDIESEELLFKRMLERIPVVEVDGRPVSELVLDESALRARLDTLMT